MQPLLAIARLTFKAAFRFRLLPVLAVLLLGAVVALPAVLKDDGTARGLAQIVLTYTLGVITTVLGLCTLWLACGTLARDIEECQMQVVAVKPVARWQVWAGKWLGVMGLNALLLGLSAGIVYFELVWRARRLSESEQIILRNEVLVARGSAKEPLPDLTAEVERRLEERLKQPTVAAMDRKEVRRLIREQIDRELQVVPPGYVREWKLDLSSVKDRVRDQYLFLRIKFFAAEKSASGTYVGFWEAGPPESSRRWRDLKSQAAETFHEFPLAQNLLDDQGILTVNFVNQNDTAILFPLQDGLEVLYRKGSFALNFFRGVGIIFCWLALLAAVGLAAASFLSFPVAAFFALGVLIIAFSTGTMNQIIEEGTIRAVDPNTGRVAEANWFDHGTVAFFRCALWTVELVRSFSPIDSLSTGRSIGWDQLARAVGQVIFLAGGLFALIGIAAFSRRELATAHSTI